MSDDLRLVITSIKREVVTTSHHKKGDGTLDYKRPIYGFRCTINGPIMDGKQHVGSLSFHCGVNVEPPWDIGAELALSLVQTANLMG